MRSKKLLSLFFLLFSLQLFSQPGSYYPGFATGGIVTSLQSGVLDELAVFPNGKIITISPRGIFAEPYGQIDWSALVKFNTDGTLDPSFGDNGHISFVQGPNGTEVKNLVMQSDGKFLVIKKGSNTIWRFNENNSLLDPTFAGDGSFEFAVFGYPSAVVEAMTLDNLGRIVITGRMISNGATPDRLFVARLNSDGTFDESFNTVGFRIVLETTGLFYKGVSCTTDNLNRVIVSVDGFGPGTPVRRDNFLTRFNENGTMDLTFGSSGRINFANAPLIVGADPQNRIVIHSDGVKRVSADGQGTPQTIFSSSTSTNIRAACIQSDGKIIVTGDEDINAPTHSHNLWLRRFRLDGSPDPTFGTNGKVLTNLQINLLPKDIYYIDRKAYVCGHILATAEGTSNLGFIIAYDATDTKLNCTSLDTIPTNPGLCYATPNNLDPILSPSGDVNLVTYKLERGGQVIEEGQGSVSGKQFPKGKTKVTYTYTDLTTQICGFDVIVADREAPSITAPATLTVSTQPGQCQATVNVSQLGTPITSDNCSSVTVTSPQMPANNIFAKGTTTLIWTATDGSGNTATVSQTVTIVDNEKPTITNTSATPAVLFPPNHQMKNVTVNYVLNDNCPGTTAVLSVSSDEPQTGINNADLGPDWEIVDDHHVKLRAERDPHGDGRVYTILITATDASGNVQTATQTVVVSHNITAPNSGATFRAGSTVNFSGTFWDVAGTTHTAKWLIDGNSIKGNVNEPSGMRNGTVTGSNKFSSPGVYKLQMNVTDQNNVTTYVNTNGDLEEIVVIYDPNGGYTYGGGSFLSQPGALVNDPLATGDVSYGFTVNYYKNASLPKGETQFEFKAGDFEFNALNFDYLVINGSKAQFRGTGKITGDQSGYGFVMTVIDGDLNGSVDKIRMKIFNKNNGRVVYDNQPGASDAADPVTPVETNSSVVIYSINSLVTKKEAETTELPMQFEVKASPNPSNGNFSLTVRSNDLRNKVKLQVVDMYGRLIEEKDISANSTVRIGDKYNTGVYIVTIKQDKTQKQIKLVKTSGIIY
jgi:uncharacterized delta-60 repeat protein